MKDDGFTPQEAKILRRHFIRKGEIIPTTEAEVILFEGSNKEPQATLPEGLKDFDALKQRKASTSKTSDQPQVARLRQIDENLARAARDGQNIPPDIEERMRKDREAAEAEQD